MKTLPTLSVFTLFTSLLGGCQEAGPSPLDEPKAAPPTTERSASDSDVGLARGDQLLAAGDAKGAAAAYDAVIASGAAGDGVARARLGKSRALASAGDREGAIVLAEIVAAVRDDDRDRSVSNEAQEWLFELLRDKKQTAFPMTDESWGAITPFSRTLVKSFEPSTPEQKMRVNIVEFGETGGEHAEAIGLFNAGGAFRAKKQESCGLCTVKTNVGTSRSRSGWMSIPANRERIRDHLVVVYFDLERNLVPSRYDDVLPIPSAELQKELAKGSGLYMVKDRGAAPPVVLIAAPRTVQLAAVQDALAKESVWPKAAVPVKVSPQYLPGEIRAHIRGALEPFRACFDAYAARVPHASIRSTLSFAIDPSGNLADVRVDSEPSDATFGECLATAARTIHFTATGQTTTVRYPITFAVD